MIVHSPEQPVPIHTRYNIDPQVLTGFSDCLAPTRPHHPVVVAPSQSTPASSLASATRRA